MKNILITGKPTVGKTTVIKKVIERLKEFGPKGFLTEEIRESGVRKGFKLIGSNKREEILSHIDFETSFRVGKYCVDLEKFEKFLKELMLEDSKSPIVFIDEIGKMECFSGLFIKTVKNILNSEKILLATISISEGGFIESIKKREDCSIYEVTLSNRNKIPDEIYDAVKKFLAY